jgi:hypothetical protein
MALDYLRQNPINDYMDETSAGVQRPAKKFSKGKMSLLLGGNLIVWVIFLVSILDIPVLSMSSVAVPHLSADLDIKGIVYHETSPSVIISNHVYGLGDDVDGYIIAAITRTTVEFKKGDKTIVKQVR